jgi:predicted nucleic acid-binding protein
MGLPDCLFDPSALLVPDASVLINLNATGCAIQILEALTNKVVITDVVIRELEVGRAKGRSDAYLVDDLLARGHAERVVLTAECEEAFLQLVAGPGLATLDDGEAATIAWAAAHKGVPIIDEKKGLAICRERFAMLRPCSTLDIFAHESVKERLGNPGLSDALYGALLNARMRVPEEKIPWVIGIIGQSRARECTSLPRSAREGA